MKNLHKGIQEGTSSPTEQRKSVFFCHLKMTQAIGRSGPIY